MFSGEKAGRDAVVETLFVYYLSVGTLLAVVADNQRA
jgi:hypothetical protein